MNIVDKNDPVGNDEVESQALVIGEGINQNVSESQIFRSGNQETFFQMMNEWFIQFMRNNLMASSPSPPPMPSTIPTRPQGVE